MLRKLSNKRGSATTVLIIIVLILAIILGLYIKLNWVRFKAEAKYGLIIALIIISLVATLYFCIRHKIRKARREREEKRAEAEK